MPQFFTKQPSENLDYQFEGEDWFNSTAGDTIANAVVTASPSGLTLGTKTINPENVIQFISGGVDGVDYKITCVISTNQGRTKEAEIFIAVRDK